MITQKELDAVKLSPTKKDFYQIWNELLDTAGKISERWDPRSTNEADPGIVLLKVLTACADKLNYTVDKNILEAFMPSATQEESMRKLCEMLGYNIKYYQSAVTDITIGYIGKAELDADNKFTIPKNTYITNNDKDVVYCTLEQVDFISKADSLRKVPAIEGQLVRCEGNNGYLINASMIDDRFRYYLPENQIAENGIFIYSAMSLQDDPYYNKGDAWTKVYNLNTQSINHKCYKFGYDSKLHRPYVQFPEDLQNIIGDGIYIDYIRTNGANGNITAKTLSAFQNSSDILHIVNGEISEDVQETEESDDNIISNADNFIVSNESATYGGKDIESINDAYNGFKKTIGTFDTLVTCRDYMNAIYNMTIGDIEYSANPNPVVSNVIVADIRDDINRAATLCTFNEYGIKYENIPYTSKTEREATTTDGKSVVIVETTPKINHFDLVLYPFKTILGMNTIAEYKNSFMYSTEYLNSITQVLNEEDEDSYFKTISHNFIIPDPDDIACIKNYVRLKAKITTTYKVGNSEESDILKNIYTAIFKAFNMRAVDFGEEIPFDTILEVIQGADTRIKNIALEEPVLYTVFSLVGGEEIEAVSGLKYSPSDETTLKGAKLFNRMTLQNVLAGKLPMFNYKTVFSTSYAEKKVDGQEPILPADDKKVVKITSTFIPEANSPEVGTKTDVVLSDNEVIQFRAPNYRTTVTYPSYVNYYLILKDQQVIAKNCEYKLKKGEYLLLNYTETSMDEDSEDVVKNIYYTEGDIIKPNFDIKNSVTNDAAYTKKTGYDFTSISKDLGDNYPNNGMYSFGAKQKVEIRKPIIIELGKPVEETDHSHKAFYFYWIRNNEKAAILKDQETILFDWDEDNGMSHTLLEGEYFFYTDSNKSDIAYYGAGTKITRTNDKLVFRKDIRSESLSVEVIQRDGLGAAIPWQQTLLGENNYIKIYEYKYISLFKGDLLENLTDISASLDHEINNEWQKLSPDTQVSYIVNYANGDKFDTKTEYLPTLADDENCWEVRSVLTYNVGPERSQTIHKDDSITIDYDDGTSDTLETTNSLSFKTNYPIYQNSETVDVESMIAEVKRSAARTGSAQNIQEFKLKVFELDELIRYTQPKGSSSEELQTLDDFNEHWTKVPLANAMQENVLTLHTLLPTDTFGIMTIYYITSETDKTKFSRLSTTGNALQIYNNNNSWWEGMTDSGTYILRPGINVIKLTNSCDVSIRVAKDKSTGTLYGSNDTVLVADLDIVDAKEEINPRLNYNVTNSNFTSAIEQLNADINEVDIKHNFYYNADIENANALDINPFIALDREDADIMSNPRMLYDYNNICNKFVISEIDADKLTSGITLTKSSKL